MSENARADFAARYINENYRRNDQQRRNNATQRKKAAQQPTTDDKTPQPTLF